MSVTTTKPPEPIRPIKLAHLLLRTARFEEVVTWWVRVYCADPDRNRVELQIDQPA